MGLGPSTQRQNVQPQGGMVVPGTFATGVFDVFHQDTDWTACCCPFYVASANRATLDGRNPADLCTCSRFVDMAGTMGTCGCEVEIYNRRKLQQLNGIPELYPFTDLLLVGLCLPCVVCQHQREIKLKRQMIERTCFRAPESKPLMGAITNAANAAFGPMGGAVVGAVAANSSFVMAQGPTGGPAPGGNMKQTYPLPGQGAPAAAPPMGQPAYMYSPQNNNNNNQQRPGQFSPAPGFNGNTAGSLPGQQPSNNIFRSNAPLPAIHQSR